MNITLNTINVFCGGEAGGIQTVFTVGTGQVSSTHCKQLAATESAGLISIVTEAPGSRIRIETFAPGGQLSSRDAAVLATAHYYNQGKVNADDCVAVETNNGVSEVCFRGGMVFIRYQPPLPTTRELDMYRLIRSLGIAIDDIAPGLMPQVVTGDRSLLLIPLRDQNKLRTTKLLRRTASQVCLQHSLDGICLFTISLSSFTDAICRAYELPHDMEEQVSTGAAAYVACFLYWNNYLRRKHIIIEQGSLTSTASKSLVHVKLETNKGTIAMVLSGGTVNVQGTKKVIVNDAMLEQVEGSLDPR